MKRILIALLLAAVVAAGCASPQSSGGQSAPAAQPASAAQPTQAAQPAPVAKPAPPKAVVNITAADLLRRLQSGEKPLIIDVREPFEYQDGHIEGARLMPLGTVEQAVKAAGLAKDQEILLICRSGNRSMQAYQKLTAAGYTNLVNVIGGMNEWVKVGPITK